jgi:L-alanine-DL-glutamate epimerase-like enolase superfamily enzyme
MNAYDEKPKGINGTRKSFLLELSDGTVGIGALGYAAVDDGVLSEIRKLIGKDIFSFYQWEGDQITSVIPDMQPYLYDAKYSWIESGLLDAIGKLKNVPVWKLFGQSVRDAIDPYDGTMYFEDIANNTDATIIGQIGKRIKNDGYRAIKIKLGRPFKWMKGEAGVNRDIESFIALREAVGTNFNIMADANNGYQDQFDWAVQLMKSCAPYRMYFMEELFPDDTTQFKNLRDLLLKDNLYVPIAEGENIRNMDIFNSYLLDGVYNYIQPDMATCGFSNIIRTARKAESFHSVNLIPHVWQNQLGLVMSLHSSRIQRNITFVEDSRYLEHAFNTSEYVFKEGQWIVPEKPGWGISLAPDYKQFIKGNPIEIV